MIKIPGTIELPKIETRDPTEVKLCFDIIAELKKKLREE